jgi:hypothetical protein
MMDEQIANYLLGELAWELEQFTMPWPGTSPARREQIEVLSYSNDNLRFRVENAIYVAHLSWRGDVAPTIIPVEEEAR